MKKLALILVFILIMGCAYAEPVLFNSVEGVNSILYANLFYVRGYNAYALMDFNGNILTEDIYAGQFNYRAGMLKTYQAQGEGINRRGVLFEDGTQAVPFQYGDVQILNENWVYGVVLTESDRSNYDYEVTSNDETKVYLIDHADIYNISNGNMFTLSRDEFAECAARGAYINIRSRATGKVTTYDPNFNAMGVSERDSIYDDTFVVYDFNKYSDNIGYGAKDAQGNVIIEPEYYSIFWQEGNHAMVKDGDKNCGIVDIYGNVIIEPQFDNIEFMNRTPVGHDSQYVIDGYVCFEQDGKLGYATSAGVTCEAKYSRDVLKVQGVSCTFTDMEGNFNIMAADGIVTTVTGYEEVNAASYSGGYYYIVRNADGKYGMIDWHGNIVFPCEYRSLEFSGDGEYVLANSESYGNFEIYTINEAQEAAPAAAEVPEEIPAEAPAFGIGSVKVPDVDFSAYSHETTAETPAEAPAEASVEAPEASADNSGAIGLLQSAKALLAADAATNGAAVQVLLDNAAAMLAGNPAAAMLDGAKTLIAADAAANSAAIITLIDSAIALL